MSIRDTYSLNLIYMNTFDWAKGIGFGVLIWLIMFALMSALVGFGVETTTTWLSVVIALIAGIISFLFAMGVKIESVGQAFLYGIFWAAIGVILDLIVTMQFTSTSLFGMWQYWLAYALVFVAPWIEYTTNEDSSTSTRSGRLSPQ